MKRKKLKAFTLVELIIVMAITSILFIMIASFFAPIGVVFADASQYDSQRTIVEEINTYITESTRYATKVTIYKNFEKLPTTVQFTPTNPAGPAVNVDPVTNALSTTSVITPTTTQKATVHVISIINIPFTTSSGAVLGKNTINSTDYTGRVYFSTGDNIESTRYEALGKWYYGKSSFYYNLNNVSSTYLELSTYSIKESASYTDFWDSANKKSKDVPQVKSDNLINNYSIGKCTFLNTSAATVLNGQVSGDLSKTAGSTAGQNTFIVYTLPA